MATYAAYRHVELDNVGYGKKRVLKPPGGGSSDIFGAAPEESPRRVKHHNQSQLGSALFGENNGTETPRIINKPDGNPITGTGYGSETSVTDSSSSSSPTPTGSEKSAESTPSSNGAPHIKRNRVPPGGYSSGLW